MNPVRLTRIWLTFTKEENRRAVKEEADEICSHLSHTTRREMELAQEKGASSWLTTLPIKEHGYALHKGAFKDAIALGGVQSPCQVYVSVANPMLSAMQ